MPVLPQRRTPTATTPGLRSDASRSESPPGCSGPLVGMIADSCRPTILLQPLPILARRGTLEELRKQRRQCCTSVWHRDCLCITPLTVIPGRAGTSCAVVRSFSHKVTVLEISQLVRNNFEKPTLDLQQTPDVLLYCCTVTLI